MTSRTPYGTRPTQVEIITRWDALLKDPLLSFESLKGKAVEGRLETSLRSLCWRYFFGLLPSPSSLSTSPSTTAIFSTYSLLLARQRSDYSDLREKYLRAPDGGWLKDGDANGEGGLVAGETRTPPGGGANEGTRPVKIDAKVNNPLGLEEDNPWQSWFADLELRKTIRQDVQRTFPEVDYFRQSSTQNKITDLLFIYTKLTPDTGYRQGMHELLAPILWIVDLESLKPTDDAESLPHLVLATDFIEHDTWSLFSALMKSCAPFYDHKSTVPLSKGPQNQSRAPTGLGLTAASTPSSSSTTLVQPIVAIATHLHSLLATLDPALHAAFTRLQIEPQLYAIRWLRLLFSREFPLSETLTLWDGIFARDPSLQVTQHVAAAMLLRIRDALITAERVGGYGEFLQVLLRYPACPDGTFQTTVLLSQAVHLRDNLSREGADFVRRQNEQLGLIRPHDEQDEETDLRSAAARGARGQRKGANGSPNVGLLGEGGLVGDLAKGVYGRAEALGINKAILGTFNDIRRGVTAAQAQIEEQRQRQRTQFSQIPSRAPWEVDSTPSTTARDALADLARMRASGVAMAEALDLCVTVLERALSPPTPNPLATSRFGTSAQSASDESCSTASTGPAPSLAPQIMAITALKHVRDVLGGQANSFDASVLSPLQQTLDLLNKSPALPPLPSDSPSLSSPPDSPDSQGSAQAFAPPETAESLPLSASKISPTRTLRTSVPSPGHNEGPTPTTTSPTRVAPPSSVNAYSASRSDKPLPTLTRTPPIARPPVPVLTPESSQSPSPLLTSYAPSTPGSSPQLSTKSRQPPSPSSRSPFDPLGVL
ncbi:hypothetical protein JCM11491_002875 [Sporobolomyces phaffii]